MITAITLGIILFLTLLCINYFNSNKKDYEKEIGELKKSIYFKEQKLLEIKKDTLLIQEYSDKMKDSSIQMNDDLYDLYTTKRKAIVDKYESF